MERHKFQVNILQIICNRSFVASHIFRNYSSAVTAASVHCVRRELARHLSVCLFMFWRKFPSRRTTNKYFPRSPSRARNLFAIRFNSHFHLDYYAKSRLHGRESYDSDDFAMQRSLWNELDSRFERCAFETFSHAGKEFNSAIYFEVNSSRAKLNEKLGMHRQMSSAVM